MLGDGAGVGKGRQLAALIYENVLKGRSKHVWFSVSADLKEDSQRDFADSDWKCGEVVLRTCRITKLTKILLILLFFFVPSSSCMFSTYSALVSGYTAQSGDGTQKKGASKKKSRLNQLIKWLCDGGTEEEFEGCIMLDECHKAKNLASKPPTQTGLAVQEIQARLPKARVVYCSATAVSEPKNLMYMQRLHLWGQGCPMPDFQAFRHSIKKRGVGAMELCAMHLKHEGSMLSRTLSYQGCEFELANTTMSDKQCASYNAAAAYWQHLWDVFLTALVAEDLYTLKPNAKRGKKVAPASDAAAKEETEKETLKDEPLYDANGDEVKKLTSASWKAQFWGAHQRFFKSMCIGLKVPACVRLAKAAVEEGKAVVIGLQSTGEANQDEAVNAGTFDDEDVLSAPKETLRRFLHKLFWVPGVEEEIEFSDSESDMDFEGEGVTDADLVRYETGRPSRSAKKTVNYNENKAFPSFKVKKEKKEKKPKAKRFRLKRPIVASDSDDNMEKAGSDEAAAAKKVKGKKKSRGKAVSSSEDEAKFDVEEPKAKKSKKAGGAKDTKAQQKPAKGKAAEKGKKQGGKGKKAKLEPEVEVVEVKKAGGKKTPTKAESKANGKTNGKTSGKTNGKAKSKGKSKKKKDDTDSEMDESDDEDVRILPKKKGRGAKAAKQTGKRKREIADPESSSDTDVDVVEVVKSKKGRAKGSAKSLGTSNGKKKGKKVVISALSSDESETEDDEEEDASSTYESDASISSSSEEDASADDTSDYDPMSAKHEEAEEDKKPDTAGTASANGEGVKALTPAQMAEAVLERRKARLFDLLDKLDDLKLPGNPLDTIVDQLGGAQQVAEMTGRKGFLMTSPEGKTVYQRRNARNGESMDRQNLYERAKFQNDEKRVAIISDAASAGISLQVRAIKAKNQRRRVHITLELPWSADKAIQQLGRSHRANQANAPEYKLLISAVGGEKRFASAVARRLETLGALTQGDRRCTHAGSSALRFTEFNVENKYGAKAVRHIITSCGKSDPSAPIAEPPQLPQEEFDAIKEAIMKNRATKHRQPYFYTDPATYSWENEPPTFIEAAAVWLQSVDMDAVANRGNKQKSEQLCKVSRFLNRLLGLEIRRQTWLFEYFVGCHEAFVSKDKKLGLYTEGISTLRGRSVRLSEGRPLNIQCTGIEPNEVVAYTATLDNGVPWSEARAMVEEAIQEAGALDKLIAAEQKGSKRQRPKLKKNMTGFHYTVNAVGKSYTAMVIDSTHQEQGWADKVLLARPYRRPRAVNRNYVYDTYNPVDDMKKAQKLWEEEYVEKAAQRVHILHLVEGKLLTTWSLMDAAVDDQLQLHGTVDKPGSHGKVVICQEHFPEEQEVKVVEDDSEVEVVEDDSEVEVVEVKKEDEKKKGKGKAKTKGKGKGKGKGRKKDESETEDEKDQVDQDDEEEKANGKSSNSKGKGRGRGKAKVKHEVKDKPTANGHTNENGAGVATDDTAVHGQREPRRAVMLQLPDLCQGDNEIAMQVYHLMETKAKELLEKSKELNAAGDDEK
ncbi:unnamed protein product [Chrysoparadoxa australica]